jgi:hypothetical protein
MGTAYLQRLRLLLGEAPACPDRPSTIEANFMTTAAITIVRTQSKRIPLTFSANAPTDRTELVLAATDDTSGVTFSTMSNDDTFVTVRGAALGTGTVTLTGRGVLGSPFVGGVLTVTVVDVITADFDVADATDA